MKLCLPDMFLGLFAGFNEDSAQEFYVEDGNHVRHSYDLNRLCLPEESADTCLIKHTGHPYAGMKPQIFGDLCFVVHHTTT